MSEEHALDEFSGPARLFPLPNLVLFPSVVQPLHIYEPQFRQMATDALAGDRLISVVLLRPGWEDLISGKPPMHKVGCIGKIIAEQSLADGRFNLLLRGLRRVRLRRELNVDRLYRVAQVELLEEVMPPDIPTAKRLRTALEEAVLPKFTGKETAKEQLRDLFHGELTLGALCDVLGFALPLPPELKQTLLERLDVVERAYHLIRLVDGLRPDPPTALHPTGGSKRYPPPDFSPN